ncbi:MAG: rRNA maturation RNase YbeY [Bacteroidetes bacterium]|jgi:rRNA maturation RNase YbeY|nr:rRNA maturation RNase YbeY [Bacteroidota bacterium]
MNNIYFLGRSRFLDKQKRNKIRRLLQTTSKKKGKSISLLNFVLVNDEALLEINMAHLQHDTYTDIITFDLRENPIDPIEGEIYISIERVAENAITAGVDFENEFIRVVSHGLLHLLGYKDKTDAQAKEMRQEEEACLSLWANLD